MKEESETGQNDEDVNEPVSAYIMISILFSMRVPVSNINKAAVSSRSKRMKLSTVYFSSPSCTRSTASDETARV